MKWLCGDFDYVCTSELKKKNYWFNIFNVELGFLDLDLDIRFTENKEN